MTASSRPARVGLVGVHGYGAEHRANLRRLGDRVRLVGAADPRPPAPGDLPDDTAALPDAAALLDADLDLDVVIVATPLHTHYPIAAEVLRRGIDLYLEKPPVVRLDHQRALTSAAAESGAVVQVGFQSLGSLAIDAIAADEFGIGTLAAVGAVGTWTRDRAYWSRARWAGRRTLDGDDVVDGVATNPLAHAVATALRIAGARRVEDVAAVDLDLFRANDIESDDTSAIRVRTASGLIVTAALTLCATADAPPTVRLRGADGSASFSYTEDAVDARAGRRRFGRVDLLENLLDHRARGSALLSSLDDSGAYTVVADAIRRTEPRAIGPEHLTWIGEGDALRPVVRDVAAWVGRAVEAQALFREVGAPWA